MWKFLLLLAVFHSALSDPMPIEWEFDPFEVFSGYGNEKDEMTKETTTFSTPIKDKGMKKMFEATHEWQVIKEGHIVPAGLDVRFNILTGVAEGRTFVSDDLFPMAKAGRFVIYNPEDPNDIYHKPPCTPAYLRDIKWEEFYEENLETLRQLINKYEKSRNTEEYVEGLKNMEEYLRGNYRLANHFLQKGGYDTIIIPNLEKDDLRIVSQALHFLTMLCDSRGICKMKAHQHGTAKLVAKFVDVQNEEYTVHKIQARAVEALSSVLRSFPQALAIFLEHEGVQLLMDAVNAKEHKHLELNLAAVIFVDDMIEDRDIVLLNDLVDGHPHGFYGTWRIQDQLYMKDYCKHVGRIFVDLLSYTKDWAAPKVLKIVYCVLNLKEDCYSTWQDNKEFKVLLADIALKKERNKYIRYSVKELQQLMKDSQYSER